MCDLSSCANRALWECDLITCSGAVILDNNQLFGTVPARLASLAGMTALDLFANELTGTIPPGFGALSAKLNTFDVASNTFTGTVPPSLYTLTSVTRLSLGGNQFKGTLPRAVGALHKLTLLTLNDNSFSGTLPLSIGSLTQLQTFLAQDNDLSGTVPAWRGNAQAWQTVSTVNISNNRFAGPVPDWSTLPLQSCDVSINSLGSTLPAGLGSVHSLSA